MSGRWVLVIAGMVGIGLGCRETGEGTRGRQDLPDAGGVMASGNAGAGGGLETGAAGGSPGAGGSSGSAGAGGSTNVAGSSSAFPSPATAFAPGSICEANGDCWYSPL